jgi:ABC-type antimicrobial peptide transport system permease subunit
MILFKLGVNNARANFARSALAILSMCIAAGFLTYAISLGRGYSQGRLAVMRSIIGGEIVAYARQFGGVLPEADSIWEHVFFSESPSSDISFFRPELLEFGYLRTGDDRAHFRSSDIKALSNTVLGTTFIYPRYQMPAFYVNQNRNLAPLRGRDLELDRKQFIHPETHLRETGRWFDESDEGQMVAIVSLSNGFAFSDQFPLQEGTKLQIQVPQISYVNGEAVFLYANLREFELTIIGILHVPTRVDENNIQLFWELPEVLIPLRTWKEIWHEVGGGEYFPEQVSIGHSNMIYLEDVVQEFRHQFPHFTFYSTIEHSLMAFERGLIDGGTPLLELVMQPAMPLDMRLPFTLMLFFNAALIVASNLLIMVNERKKEIAIMKAVGSIRREIITIVLTESVVISLLGITAGFLIYRIPMLLNQIIAGVAFWVSLQSIVIDILIVYSISLLFTLVFGMLPGLKTANLSVMEVFRGE